MRSGALRRRSPGFRRAASRRERCQRRTIQLAANHRGGFTARIAWEAGWQMLTLVRACVWGNAAAGDASVSRDASVYFDTGTARRTAEGQAFIRRRRSEPEPGAQTTFPRSRHRSLPRGFGWQDCPSRADPVGPQYYAGAAPGLDKGNAFRRFRSFGCPGIRIKQRKSRPIGTWGRFAHLIMRTSVHMSALWTRSVRQGYGHWARFVWILRQEPRAKAAFDVFSPYRYCFSQCMFSSR